MATTLDPQPAAPETSVPVERAAPQSQFVAVMRRVLAPLASLKLTVVLFALSIFIVLAGTLAQVNADIWEIINQYFRVEMSDLFHDSFPWINVRALFVWIDLQLFLPPSFFPSRPDLPSWMGFPFPKGWLIGALMMVNLFAAHTLRFKVQATGRRLWSGLGVLAVGALVTTLVILSGSNADGFQGEAFIEWSTLWSLLQVGLLVLAASAVYGIFTAERGATGIRWMLGVTAALLIAALLWTIVPANARLDDAYMRILYQLIKGTLAGLVLLAGCIMLFRKRAGIVLIHAGVGLIMVSEVLVGVQAEEAQMRIEEGASSNFVEDIRTYELAFVAHDGTEEKHVVVPARLLVKDETVSDPALPVEVKVVEFYKSASVVPLARGGDAPNPATTGVGKSGVAVPMRASVGTDTGAGVDMPAAYVQLIDKQTKKDLGTYLVSAELDLFNLGDNHQVVSVDGRDYDVALRFKRTYKPYVVTLDDIRKEDYIGTSTPRDFSSFVGLVDSSRGIVREGVRIWMNNPLRYAGETFYQSSYHAAGTIPGSSKEWTALQVVKNTGWMIPYVACMIVLVGMFGQFGLTLLRFLQRRDRIVPLTAPTAAISDDVESKTLPRRRAATPPATQIAPAAPSRRGRWLIFAPLITVVVFGGYLLSKARVPKAKEGTVDLIAFGKLPIVSEGRPKPIDTLARNSLLIISDRQDLQAQVDGNVLKDNWAEVSADIRKKWPAVTAEDVATFSGNLDDLAPLAKTIAERSGHPLTQVDGQLYELTSEKQPAIRWLLDVASEKEVSRHHRVFRIENLDLLDTLGLPRRDGFRYSISEFGEKLPALGKQLKEANDVSEANKDNLNFFQRKLLEFWSKLQAYQKLQAGFALPALPPLPEMETLKADEEGFRSKLLAFMSEARAAEAEIKSANTALVIPYKPADSKEKAEWMPFSIAILHAYVNGAIGVEVHKDDPREETIAFNEIIASYYADDAARFNKAVSDYQSKIAPVITPQVELPKVSFEVFFNNFAPFYYCAVLYLVAFLLTCLSWLGWSGPLSRSAFWLMCFTLIVHTFAIGARIYISGRPPVTNLYSSAVFIGWACVALGLLLERIYKLGVGNIIASVAGFITLGIAHFLAGDGDTFTVLQAVLDTQFWLATHVVCITLGYATTYVAGLLGLVYILRGVLTRSLTPSVGKDLTRMTYGALCFAIFFSFIGTVLGGLWADDSWGRFWGWDPKENGALIIVLWNALVLHARWDGMVKDRGLAVLAVLGNIAVSWSWFGVNELGVGLHSYGFTEGVLMALGAFCVTQLVVGGLGCLPKQLWWSQQRNPQLQATD